MWYKMVQPPLAVASVHFVFCLVYLASEGGASVDDFCTDVSYWDVLKYQTTIKQCCETELKQRCTFKSDHVCKKVPEIQCEVVSWPLCESTPTLTESKKCEVKYRDYSYIHCKDVKSSITHTKKVPECREITRENCVTDWKVDANGNKVWSGKETCTPVRWEECGIVERQVELPMMRTDCSAGSIVKWVDIVDKTKHVTGLKTQCQIKSSVDCKKKTVTKCASVSWEECSMVPAEECQPVEVYTPSQEKVHRKNCFNPNAAELTSVQASPPRIPDEMHNIGKLLSGYDIMKGNPLPVELLPVDPGFRQPIFEASYQSGSITADRRYLQPDGTTISSCIGACSLNFESTLISGSKSYQESLAKKVGLSIGAWGGKFSASVGYKEVAEKTSSDSNLFTLSSASCCAYSAEILSFKHPSLSQNFRDGVETLTEKYDEKIYLNFIEAFGTHFIRKALMGALYGEQTEISREAWTTLQEKGIDISTAAELSAYGVTGSASSSSDEDKKNAADFSKKAEDQKTFTIGVKPPTDGDKGTWLQKTISDPAPIELTLGGSILDLLEHDDIKAEVSTAIRANLKKALDDYCNLLLKSGEAKTCSSPGPDPAFPSPASGGYEQTGSFTLDGGSQGFWGSPQYCTFPHIVNKMQLRWQGDVWGDDSALNGIQLTCTDGRLIGSSIGSYGSWRGTKTCAPGSFIKSVKIRADKASSNDNTAANGIRFKCSDGVEHFPGDGYWGLWTSWHYCPQGSYIYGIQTQIDNGGYDITGLNDVIFFCAKLQVCPADETLTSECTCGGNICPSGGRCASGSRCIPGNELRLYEQVDEAGRSLTLYRPTNLQLRNFNNLASSVHAVKGDWELYVNSDYSGNRMVVKQGQKINTDRNDEYSSARPICEYHDDPSTAKLKVYERVSSQGEEKEFLNEERDLGNDWSNKISSVHVVKGDWELYEHKNYHGVREVVKEGDQIDIQHNDFHSSLRPICETYTYTPKLKCTPVRIEILDDPKSTPKFKGTKIIGAASGFSCNDPSTKTLTLNSVSIVTNSISLGTSKSEGTDWSDGKSATITAKTGFMGTGIDVSGTISRSTGGSTSVTHEETDSSSTGNQKLVGSITTYPIGCFKKWR